MSFEYKPLDAQDLPFDPQRCKASTPSSYGYRFFQCQRKAAKDGWCWQHNPEREKARRKASLERSHRKFENRPYIRCLRKLEKVTAQRDLLLAALEAVEWTADFYGNEICWWCDAESFGDHAPDCQRQAAIAAVRGEQDEAEAS